MSLLFDVVTDDVLCMFSSETWCDAYSKASNRKIQPISMCKALNGKAMS